MGISDWGRSALSAELVGLWEGAEKGVSSLIVKVLNESRSPGVSIITGSCEQRLPA